MSIAVTLTKSFRLDNRTFSESRSLVANEGIDRSESMAAAKTGSLTTRTSNTDGTLTMAAGHGITTAARISIFWMVGGVGGHRRNVLVGTVATNSVPISGGAGDNLPPGASNITAMVERSVEMRFDGDDLQALFAGCPGQMVAWFSDDANTEQYVIALPYAGQAFEWNIQSGRVNPLAGLVVTHVHIAHGDSTGTRTIDVGAAIN